MSTYVASTISQDHEKENDQSGGQEIRAILLTPSDSVPEEIGKFLAGIQAQLLDVLEEFRAVNSFPKDPFRAEDLFDIAFVPRLHQSFSNSEISIFDAIQKGKSDATSAWKEKKKRPPYCQRFELDWNAADFPVLDGVDDSEALETMEDEKNTARKKFWTKLERDTSALKTNESVGLADHDIDSSGLFQLPAGIDSRVNMISKNKITYGLLLLLKPARERGLWKRTSTKSLRSMMTKDLLKFVSFWVM